MVAAKLATMKNGRPETTSIDAVSKAEACEALKVGVSTLDRARKIQRIGAPELVAAVEAVEVGNALSEIRDSRIYRATHATFEDYCRGRWGWNASRARQMIGAAETATRLATVTDVTPDNEAQTRPLAKLEPEQQPAAWEKAKDIAKEEGKPVTARHDLNVDRVAADLVLVLAGDPRRPRARTAGG